MSGSLASPNSQPVFRIDKFKVPAGARDEFLERVRTTHQLLRTLPGMVRDEVFEQAGGPPARSTSSPSWNGKMSRRWSRLQRQRK